MPPRLPWDCLLAAHAEVDQVPLPARPLLELPEEVLAIREESLTRKQVFDVRRLTLGVVERLANPLHRHAHPAETREDAGLDQVHEPERVRETHGVDHRARPPRPP